MKQCPLCKGLGKIASNKHKIELTNKVKLLKKKGATVREIAYLLNKGATTIQYHIKKGDKQ